MYISKVKIHNYKSFQDSQELRLPPGFNVIVGQNNVGKTALLETLSLQFQNKPHRSLTSHPNREVATNPESLVEIHFELTKKDLSEVLSIVPFFYVPTYSGDPKENIDRFLKSITETNTFFCQYGSGSIKSTYLLAYGNAPTNFGVCKFLVDKATGEIRAAATVLTIPSREAPYSVILANALKTRVYCFKAERLNTGQSPFGHSATLLPDASNLAETLNILQSNVHRFRRFNEYVRTIFPEIQQVTIPPSDTHGYVRILVWGIDPKTERDDLAMPVLESGTGIGQVLAMLYVVMTSEFPRVIIIDEPQSFLHPGAIQKLMGILRGEQSRIKHQFIIATHSPTVITSAIPEKLILMRKEEAISTFQEINVAEAKDLRMYLLEIGARLSDVFGADNILWVEGSTEEQCFPLIVERLQEQSLLGTQILGVIHTGDFESRYSRTVFEIYEKLSTGESLLPPAIGFIFDREKRTEEERKDLERQGKGLTHFLKRKMYENYLLNLQAIAAVASDISGFRDAPLVSTDVEKWLKGEKWNREYFDRDVKEEEKTTEFWLENVHGVKILEDIFKKFSDQRVTYDKVRYGYALTEWLVEHAPQDLSEIAELLKKVLNREEPKTSFAI